MLQHYSKKIIVIVKRCTYIFVYYLTYRRVHEAPVRNAFCHLTLVDLCDIRISDTLWYLMCSAN